MATKNENRVVGTEMEKKKKVKLGVNGETLRDVGDKDQGDAEAGVDPQVDQLNEMPNDPTDRPKERKK
ncbi:MULTISPECIES: hypothetical protein [Sphingobacterium]|jgi:hypothetical protein|uniref:Uncharacterized protein n=2 Tax=Sphingobacterium TaxID=28453 RepID=A0ACD5CA75_9SPHI|nr:MULTISPECIES: hypothetical protein [Sphingobacterium]HAE65848.1 hypothetical protein [Sphingobacterium sp.]MDF2852044.1 hypothetical protein [Sphingobacterium multivorum]OFV16696.1 hypothetical protein HMPREF3127_10245 [Sphingobacterium sp. HMSC13C05]OJZ11297.1 MAG: hypothetical protein BGP15_05155 [Sphingobacterium sp. 40-24]QQT45657.1 hypothetical protein I6J00_02955 [Sphingobacterium multivorum]